MARCRPEPCWPHRPLYTPKRAPLHLLMTRVSLQLTAAAPDLTHVDFGLAAYRLSNVKGRVRRGSRFHLNKGRCQMTNDKITGTVRGHPEATGPASLTDHARADLLVMNMLLAGMSQLAIRLRTLFSWAHVNRLANLVADEEARGLKPCAVPRDCRQTWPARVPNVRPHQDTLSYPARAGARAR